MQPNKQSSKRRTLMLALIAAGCILCFAAILWAVLTWQSRQSGQAHTMPQSAAPGIDAGPVLDFSELDVQVITDSTDVEGVLTPQEILPLAQQLARRICEGEFSDFVMMEFSRRESTDRRAAGYVWYVQADVTPNTRTYMTFDATTGQDLSCDSWKKVNSQRSVRWNAYAPITPPEFEFVSPEDASAYEPTSEEVAERIQSFVTTKNQIQAFIDDNRDHPGIARARDFVTEKGLLGEAQIEDAWLRHTGVAVTPPAPPITSVWVYEIKLNNGEWLVVSEHIDAGFCSYYRTDHCRLDELDTAIESLKGGQ